jgi:hypothetical protein
LKGSGNILREPDAAGQTQLQMYAGALPAASSRSRIYGRRLTQDEIRLICIPAITEEAAPLHLSVEVHQHDRCPEYETLSYTWGVEDNDSRLHHPIYIGPYWDVLLQTRNCWDMIRFLRPSRGVRLVWIDAICINQLDNEEKKVQVGKMSRIYEDCRRVVVYLGSDILHNDPRQHPYKMKLRDALQLNDDPGQPNNAIIYNLPSFFNRRYFTRVWIIQELAMSPRVVIPFHDMELWVDNRAPLDPKGWDLTPVPWFKHVSQQRLHASSVYEVLEATWKNGAADIRDKIFGVHALFSSPASSIALKPDWSLSCLEVYIGVFSHLLIYEECTEIIYNAAGISAVGSCPTWLPDWTVSDTAPLFRQLPKHMAWQQRTLDRSGLVPWTGEPSHQLLRVTDNQSRDKYRELLYSEDWLKTKYNHQHERELSEPAWLTSYGQPNSIDMNKYILHVDTAAETNFSEPGHTDRMNYKSLQKKWSSTASVDALTSGLTMDLIYILQFQDKPRPWGIWDGCQLYQLDSSSKTATMYLTVQSLALDQIIVPSVDKLFLLFGGLYLILRPAGSQAQKYKLVGVCSHLCLEVDTGDYIKVVGTHMNYKYNPEGGPSQYGLRRRAEERVFVTDLIHSAENLLSNARRRLRWPEEEEEARLSTLFPGGLIKQSVLEKFVQHVLSMVWDGGDELTTFADAYVAFTYAYVAKIERRAYKDYVEMTINLEEWESMHKNFFEIAYNKKLQSLWEWRRERKHRWFSKSIEFDGGPQKRIHLRASSKNIMALVRETDTYQALASLTNIARRQGKTQQELVRQPKHEQTHIADPLWPQSVVDGFDIDGSTYTVTII